MSEMLAGSETIILPWLGEGSFVAGMGVGMLGLVLKEVSGGVFGLGESVELFFQTEKRYIAIIRTNKIARERRIVFLFIISLG